MRSNSEFLGVSPVSSALRLAGFLLILLATTAAAQDYRARVQGTVTDSSQALVVGARVTLLNPATGISAQKSTDEVGRYLFDFVEPGPYQLRVEMPGFATVIQENIQV